MDQTNYKDGLPLEERTLFCPVCNTEYTSAECPTCPTYHNNVDLQQHLIDKLEQDLDWDKQQEEIMMKVWHDADSEAKQAIDDIFTCLMGYSFSTLLETFKLKGR